MSDNKLSPVEAAKMILEGAKEILKKNEDMLKAANTAHVIEDGAKPDTSDAECPPSLTSSEHSESREMEDTPLQDSDEDEKEDKEESEEKEYEFAKSETGMHTVEYKRLAKANTFGTGGMSGSSTSGIKGFGSIISGGNPPPVNKDEDGKVNPSFDREKKDIEWTNAQKKMIDATRPGGRGKPESKRSNQGKAVEEAKQRRKQHMEADEKRKKILGKSNEMEKCGEMKRSEGADHDAKEIDSIDWDKKGKKDMDKCGDMKAGKKLKKFMEKSKNRCWEGYEPVPGKKPYSEDSCKKK